MAKRTSKTRLKLAAVALFVVCMALPWVLSPSGCQFDTHPIGGPRLKHWTGDRGDADSGD